MIGAEVAARYTAKVGIVLSPLPLNQTLWRSNTFVVLVLSETVLVLVTEMGQQ